MARRRTRTAKFRDTKKSGFDIYSDSQTLNFSHSQSDRGFGSCPRFIRTLGLFQACSVCWLATTTHRLTAELERYDSDLYISGRKRALRLSSKNVPNDRDRPLASSMI